MGEIAPNIYNITKKVFWGVNFQIAAKLQTTLQFKHLEQEHH